MAWIVTEILAINDAVEFKKATWVIGGISRMDPVNQGTRWRSLISVERRVGLYKVTASMNLHAASDLWEATKLFVVHDFKFVSGVRANLD